MSESVNVFLWQEFEISFTTQTELERPYLEFEADVTFIHESGETISRPTFWDGGNIHKVRFAPTKVGRWRWEISPQSNLSTSTSREIYVTRGEDTNRFYQHGFWKMSIGKRNLVHADNFPALLVADTAWAMPWRARIEDVEIYAKDRSAKGFNATLLMTMQPDMKARGPRGRNIEHGFEVAFEDLEHGTLQEINIEYFQYFDQITQVLIENEIAPIYQPVFFGFGWKGLEVAGPVIPPDQYARYCRYLVARYGARPAIYLVGADGSGIEPQIEKGGVAIHECDAYQQPTGLHYRPHSLANSHQAADWLDFQWCQTGHGGEHIQERVREIWRNQPIKAVANGEPSYEQSGSETKAVGWWQGHEAWANLFAGGTMGIFYGAGSLWMWRVSKSEADLEPGFQSPNASWLDALSFEGSTFVGLVGKILDGLPITDMEPYWENIWSPRGLLVPKKLFLVYQEGGEPLTIFDQSLIPKNYSLIDPTNGEELASGSLQVDSRIIGIRHQGPVLYIFRDI